MGQAKKRGNKESRIAQALEKQKLTVIDSPQKPNPYDEFKLTNRKIREYVPSTTFPKVGIYIATILDEGMEVFVSEVTEPDEDGFFLVTMSTENDIGWPDAIETELVSDDWFEFALKFALIPSPYD